MQLRSPGPKAGILMASGALILLAVLRSAVRFHGAVQVEEESFLLNLPGFWQAFLDSPFRLESMPAWPIGALGSALSSLSHLDEVEILAVVSVFLSSTLYLAIFVIGRNWLGNSALAVVLVLMVSSTPALMMAEKNTTTWAMVVGWILVFVGLSSTPHLSRSALLLLILIVVLICWPVTANPSKVMVLLSAAPMAYIYSRLVGPDRASARATLPVTALCILLVLLFVPSVILQIRATGVLSYPAEASGMTFAASDIRRMLEGGGAWWERHPEVYQPLAETLASPFVMLTRWFVVVMGLVAALVLYRMRGGVDDLQVRKAAFATTLAIVAFLISGSVALGEFSEFLQLLVAFREPWARFHWLWVLFISLAALLVVRELLRSVLRIPIIILVTCICLAASSVALSPRNAPSGWAAFSADDVNYMERFWREAAVPTNQLICIVRGGIEPEHSAAEYLARAFIPNQVEAAAGCASEAGSWKWVTAHPDFANRDWDVFGCRVSAATKFGTLIQTDCVVKVSGSPPTITASRP